MKGGVKSHLVKVAIHFVSRSIPEVFGKKILTICGNFFLNLLTAWSYSTGATLTNPIHYLITSV